MTRAKGKRQQPSKRVSLLVSYRCHKQGKDVERDASFEIPEVLLPSAEQAADPDAGDFAMDKFFRAKLARKHRVRNDNISIIGVSYA